VIEERGSIILSLSPCHAPRSTVIAKTKSRAAMISCLEIIGIEIAHQSGRHARPYHVLEVERCYEAAS
jgi:hypothetical protein